MREIPIHPKLRKALDEWLDERGGWPNANENPALFLNQRGGRLSARGAHDIITGIAARHGLDEHVTAHVLRHSFATTLVRGTPTWSSPPNSSATRGSTTTRLYTRPSAEDRAKAIDLLVVDE